MIRNITWENLPDKYYNYFIRSRNRVRCADRSLDPELLVDNNRSFNDQMLYIYKAIKSYSEVNTLDTHMINDLCDHLNCSSFEYDYIGVKINDIR